MADPVRLIKKYPNRRLYDTQTSAYITLADVKQLVLDTEPFRVADAKTSEDLTRSILLQIILEEETGGVPMFSTQALAQIIRFYGHAMQGVMGNYLEKNLQAFVDMQGRLAEQEVGARRGRRVGAIEGQGAVDVDLLRPSIDAKGVCTPNYDVSHFAWLKRHRSRYAFTEIRVGNTENGTLHDAWKAIELHLDFLRIDVVASCDDQVLGST